MNVELKTQPISKPNSLRLSRRCLAFAFAGWAILLAAGFAFLADRDSRPAPQGDPAAHWPAASHWQFSHERPTLLMFVHPRCPCSRASVAELEGVLAKHPGADARLVMVKPEGAPDDWDQSATAQAAKELPGVTIVRDERGDEAKRFGALTSGQTYLYDTQGELLFRGGITAGRGHFGNNASSDMLLKILADGKANQQATPVYGCPLENEDTSKSKVTK